jgi:hypothetical protein
VRGQRTGGDTDGQDGRCRDGTQDGETMPAAPLLALHVCMHAHVGLARSYVRACKAGARQADHGAAPGRARARRWIRCAAEPCHGPRRARSRARSVLLAVDPWIISGGVSERHARRGRARPGGREQEHGEKETHASIVGACVCGWEYPGAGCLGRCPPPPSAAHPGPGGTACTGTGSRASLEVERARGAMSCHASMPLSRAVPATAPAALFTVLVPRAAPRARQCAAARFDDSARCPSPVARSAILPRPAPGSSSRLITCNCNTVHAPFVPFAGVLRAWIFTATLTSETARGGGGGG